MHRLASDQTLSGSDEIAKLLFEICDDKTIKEIRNPNHQMPLFDDTMGNSPFDYVLQIANRSESEIAAKKELGSFNKNLALVLFDKYKNHEFMSLGRSITRAIPEAIFKEVQTVTDFMKARSFTSELFWPTCFV